MPELGTLVSSSLIRETTENVSANLGYKFGQATSVAFRAFNPTQAEETYSMVTANPYTGATVAPMLGSPRTDARILDAMKSALLEAFGERSPWDSVNAKSLGAHEHTPIANLVHWKDKPVALSIVQVSEHEKATICTRRCQQQPRNCLPVESAASIFIHRMVDDPERCSSMLLYDTGTARHSSSTVIAPQAWTCQQRIPSPLA